MDAETQLEEPRLTTERLILRLPSVEDLSAILAYVLDNAEHLRPWEPERPAAYYTAVNWLDQIKRGRDDYAQGSSLRLLILPRRDPRRVIGIINFTGIMRGVAQFGFLGYSLGADAQGHGYMTEALQAAVPYVFTELNLHRLMANYMPRNERSGQVLARLGFEIEGHARQYLRINGVWEDHVLTAKINPDWQAGD